MSKVHETSKRSETHIIMDLVDGIDMEQYIEKHGKPKDIRVIKRVGRQLISAITYLHEQKVIHQDLKPSNVLINEESKNVTIIDLGISKKRDKTANTRQA